ncbi:PREDICTED: bone morphogenetic protein 15 [Gekko japonicus]|uniref:Bone morphogenetic protein 15 n=1 Tax=Gekko japonicus TaxID=146911 RepID=A0ABM1JSI5_GEKJA|nr:PREDICTED: bone morphogenetic protein 15 [Gekko japonicus]
MASLGTLCLCGALFLLAMVFPLEHGLGVGQVGPASVGALSGAPSLPLIQVLLGKAPPKTRPQGRNRRIARGQPLRYMLNLYRSVADRHGRPRRNRKLATNTIRLVKPFAKARQPGAGPWLVWNLDYRLEIQPQVEHLVRATLVYSQTLSLAQGEFLCTAELLSSKDAIPRTTLSLTSPRVGKRNATAFSTKDSWVEMDLSTYLQPWVWAAQNSQVLHVRHACAYVGQPWGSIPDPGWEDAVSLNDPFLLLYLNDTLGGLWTRLGGLGSGEAPFEEKRLRRPVQTRQARQAGNLALDLPSYLRTNSIKKRECSLHPFRVSFQQLGWDHWIIAPHSYQPQYCKGNCPRILHFGYHSPNHAIIQNFINELVDKSVPPPSCVPYEYSPISILMMEQNGTILYKVYEDMIAKSCTCR